MVQLNPEAVTAIMKECLYKAEELKDIDQPADAVLVKGIVRNFGFHPERVKAAKPRIDALLNELPKPFHKDTGGGWSFLKACEDKDGNLWGQHPDMEALICLGIAVGSAQWMLKEHVRSLPGGMPYVMITTSPETRANGEHPQPPG